MSGRRRTTASKGPGAGDAEAPDVIDEYLNGRVVDERSLELAREAQASEPDGAPLSMWARLYLNGSERP